MSEHLAQYLSMGGYAAFVWPSYALAVVLLVGVFVLAARRLEAATRALDDPERDDADGAS